MVTELETLTAKLAAAQQELEQLRARLEELANKWVMYGQLAHDTDYNQCLNELRAAIAKPEVINAK
jgi:multidrug resistance efflux pump